MIVWLLSFYIIHKKKIFLEGCIMEDEREYYICTKCGRSITEFEHNTYNGRCELCKDEE